MKINKIYLGIISIMLLFSMGCTKEQEKQVSAFVRQITIFFSEHSGDLFVTDFIFDGKKYFPDESEDNVHNPELKNNISYSYKMVQKVPGSVLVKSYVGTLDLNAFIKGKKNTVSILGNATSSKILVNGQSADIGSGGGGSSGYNCVSGNCVAVSSGAQYSTLSACQTSCSSGTSVLYTTVLNGGSKDRQYAQFVVPAGVKSMEVRTNESTAGFSNHADLFVRRGSKPTCNADPFTGYVADCASMSNNREQDFCNFTNPSSGTWYVMLYNYNGVSYKSNLVVTITK